MKKKAEYQYLMILLTILMFFLPTTIASVNPTISIEPEKPKPQDTVTFTVIIPEDTDISEVVIAVDECESNICFVDKFNQTMTQTDYETYQATITLRHASAVEIKYRVGYSTASNWVWYPVNANDLFTVTLDTSNNNDNNSPDNNGTPGFELAIFAFATIFISFILFRRRR